MSFLNGADSMPATINRRQLNYLLPAAVGVSTPTPPASQFFFADQAPKNPLSTPVPPVVTAPVQAELDAFLSTMTQLGIGNYEGSTTGTFNYTGGTATTSGGPVANVSNFVVSFTLGRYNMTPIADPFITEGRWLQTSATFSYNFSLAIQCIGFYITDLGDFEASLVLNFYNGASLVDTYTVVPTQMGNGTLAFFGASLSTPFNRLEFVIVQVNPGSPDLVGFDMVRVGQQI